MTTSELNTVLSPFVLELSSDVWFTGRLSACSLIPATYKQMPKNRSQLKNAFFKLCKDKEFSIRKSLSASFNTVYSLLYESLVLVNADDYILLENEMLLIFEYFFKDEKDIYFNLINSVDEFMLRLSCSNRHVILKKLISKINSSKFKVN